MNCFSVISGNFRTRQAPSPSPVPRLVPPAAAQTCAAARDARPPTRSGPPYSSISCTTAPLHCISILYILLHPFRRLGARGRGTSWCAAGWPGGGCGRPRPTSWRAWPRGRSELNRTALIHPPRFFLHLDVISFVLFTSTEPSSSACCNTRQLPCQGSTQVSNPLHPRLTPPTFRLEPAAAPSAGRGQTPPFDLQ